MDEPDFGTTRASIAQRSLVEGQWVWFQPSAVYKGATPLNAKVTRVWAPNCVDLSVEYPERTRAETSVLVNFPGQVRPNLGYYCFPKDEVS